MLYEDEIIAKRFHGFNPEFYRRVMEKRGIVLKDSRTAPADPDALEARREIDRMRRREARMDEDQRSAMSLCPSWVRAIVIEICALHAVDVVPIMRGSRRKKHVKCRNEIQYLLYSHDKKPSAPQIGWWLRRDHTSVLHSVWSHARDTGSPHVTGYQGAAR